MELGPLPTQVPTRYPSLSVPKSATVKAPEGMAKATSRCFNRWSSPHFISKTKTWMSITPAISAGTNFVVASPKKAVRNVPTVNGSANVAPPNGTSAVIAWPANFVIVTGSEMLAPMPKVPEKEAPENQSNRKKG